MNKYIYGWRAKQRSRYNNVRSPESLSKRFGARIVILHRFVVHFKIESTRVIYLFDGNEMRNVILCYNICVIL